MCIDRTALRRIMFLGIYCPRCYFEKLNAEDASRMSRRLDTCEDCIEAIVLVCEDAVPSVCALVGVGPPISDIAEAAISTLCKTFRTACSDSSATEACAVQCEDSDDNTSSMGRSNLLSPDLGCLRVDGFDCYNMCIIYGGFLPDKSVLVFSIFK